MNQPISPFRFSPDDFEGLDKKTRDGLAPLLDSLNTFAQQTVAFSQGVPAAAQTRGTLSTDAAGAVTITIKPLTASKPVALYLDALQLAESGTITDPYSFAWQLIGASISVTFAGLAADTKYTFAFSMR